MWPQPPGRTALWASRTARARAVRQESTRHLTPSSFRGRAPSRPGRRHAHCHCARPPGTTAPARTGQERVPRGGSPHGPPGPRAPGAGGGAGSHVGGGARATRSGPDKPRGSARASARSPAPPAASSARSSEVPARLRPGRRESRRVRGNLYTPQRHLRSRVSVAQSVSAFGC